VRAARRAADAAAMRKMVSLINGLCYRPHSLSARPGRRRIKPAWTRL